MDKSRGTLQKNVLQGLTVREAMRRQIISLPAGAGFDRCIRALIKYKVNALLVTGHRQEALGVVSKTDLMGAYYAGLPLTTPLQDIMVGPPRFCRADDSLDAALDVMRAHRIHRLYVEEEQGGQAAGVLAYPDIVGLLYRYCHRCDRSILRSGKTGADLAEHLTVREVMTPGVEAVAESAGLAQVMEALAAARLAAVLVRDETGLPVGVVSKTDLILAYLHGLPHATPARTIMNFPVQDLPQDEMLALAVQQMIFSDIHRLFVYKEDHRDIVGVLSLSDAARFRSGACRACLTSRIKI
ncbi:MAG: CBS domain-containing protein [Deltaproteobacteria bacterium]|nr:CBS domain-containing protein [Deltaproteobacteria bacterium]